MNTEMIFHQLFEKETSTYTYLLADPVSREAIIIDPVIDTIERDVKLIEDLGVTVKYILDTHVHADHITSSGELRKRTGAKVGVSSAYDLSCPDLHLDDGQELSFGKYKVKVIHTPGHTSGCITYQVGDMIFTGDALLIRGCGRTDFQEGSSEKLFSSVREKLFSLPDDTIIYPAHDYKGYSKSSIGLEKRLNPRLKLQIKKEEFIEIMNNLKLPYPKRIQEAVPANVHCGLPSAFELPKGSAEIQTISPEMLHAKMGLFKIVDVRGTDEFNGELGHIPNAQLVTLGPELNEFLAQEDNKKSIVFVCRSGRRSADATKIASGRGFERVYNLEGGMIHWNESRLPIQRDMGGS